MRPTSGARGGNNWIHEETLTTCITPGKKTASCHLVENALGVFYVEVFLRRDTPRDAHKPVQIGPRDVELCAPGGIRGVVGKKERVRRINPKVLG
jgi:hypothetical protein